MLFGSSNQPDIHIEPSSSRAFFSQCSESLNAHPYLVTEEEAYEPPADPDSGEATSFLVCYRFGLTRACVVVSGFRPVVRRARSTCSRADSKRPSDRRHPSVHELKVRPYHHTP